MMRLFFALLLLLPAGNNSWEKISVATSASLRGLSIVDENVIWASGTDGTILRTTDAGKNWSVIKVPGAEDQDFRGIHAFDQNTAVIVSAGKAEEGKARIYRTTDAGQNWKIVDQEKAEGIFFDAIAFWDRNHGIVLSDPVGGKFALFTSDDAGSSWKQVPSGGIPPALANEGAFAASNSCITVEGSRNAWFVTGGAKLARVFHSSDRGRTWTVADTPLHPANSSSGLFSIAFRDARHGVAVGGDYAHPEKSDLPNVLTTDDGGKTWRLSDPTEPPGVYFSSVAYPSVKSLGELATVGIEGQFFKPANGSWARQNSGNLNTIAFTRSGQGFAIGAKGLVLRQNQR